MRDMKVKVSFNKDGGKQTHCFYSENGVQKSTLLNYEANVERAKMAILSLRQRALPIFPAKQK